jgi:GT2 family glycosyltransferase
MDLSVVIVSYNTKELLSGCLLSLQKAFKNINAEVFVVDNNSYDQTAEMVKRDFPAVILRENGQNLGFAKANNQALKKVKGKYIVILNPDTQVMPDTFEKMISFMEKNANAAVATCRVELPDGTLDKDCRRRFPTPWRAFTHFSGLAKIFKGSKIFDQYHMGYISDKKEHEVDACVGAFMILRKTAMNKVGLFDEDFFFYGEDLDLCWRFREKGYKIVYTPITKIVHYKGAASGMKASSKHLSKATRESKKRALYESVHAMEIFYKKHFLRKYPFFINFSVLAALKVLERIRTLKA